MGGIQNNRAYDADASGNADYQRCHSKGRSLLKENGANGSASELGIEEIDSWRTDSDIEAYPANHSAPGEYRDAERAIDFDGFKHSRKLI